MQSSFPQLERLIDVIAQLRDPKTGCPWDLKQTHQSLTKYLIEECYEFLAAVENDSNLQMEEEIGDVLLQVLLHAQIAKDESRFDIESVAKKLGDKLIFRHPHVFKVQDGQTKSADQVEQTWDELKQKEKKNTSGSSIDEALLSLPSLMSAQKIGKRTNKLNFDWEDYHQVVYKVEEEWQEVKEELTPHRELNLERVEEELGDLLFSVAQLARHLKLDPEMTLRKANKKFLDRFKKMEELIQVDDENLLNLSSKEIEAYWNHAKLQIKQKDHP